MKKRVYGKKLSRGRGARKALFRSLVRALVANGSIKTTRAKAKAVQGDVDRLVNLAKSGDVVNIRRVYAKLGNDRQTAEKLIKQIANKFKDVNSGYTRAIPLPQRKGDLAEMVRLEWVKEIKEESKKKDTETKDEKKGVKEKLKSVTKRSSKSSKSKSSKKGKSGKTGKGKQTTKQTSDKGKKTKNKGK